MKVFFICIILYPDHYNQTFFKGWHVQMFVVLRNNYDFEMPVFMQQYCVKHMERSHDWNLCLKLLRVRVTFIFLRTGKNDLKLNSEAN